MAGGWRHLGNENPFPARFSLRAWLCRFAPAAVAEGTGQQGGSVVVLATRPCEVVELSS